MSDEVDEVEVNGQGWGLALGLGLLWALVTGATWSEGPGWAASALLASAPVVMLLSICSAMTRRVLIISAQGLRLTRRPVALWDLAWVPRAELAFVALDERELQDSDGNPHRTAWAVVAHLRDGSHVTLADGYRDAQSARALADRIRRITRC